MSSPLIPALSQVVRGLSALFWGIPAALLLQARSAIPEGWVTIGLAPLIAANGLLVYGIWQLRVFQPQERVWRSALDRAQLLSIALVGLAPFSHWWGRRPEEPFLQISIYIQILFGLMFLLLLNRLLVRLAAMLPDETLRNETRFFSSMNSQVLILLALLFLVYLGFRSVRNVPRFLSRFDEVISSAQVWLILFPVLLPVALTMTMVWKTKEVIVAGVYTERR